MKQVIIDFSGHLIINEEEFHRRCFSRISDDSLLSIEDYLHIKENNPEELEDVSINMDLCMKHCIELMYEDIDINMEHDELC